MRVLLVEDDRLLGDGLAAGLKESGFSVDWVRDGVAAEAALAAESFAAVVLDLGLPRRDGLSVLETLRGRRWRIRKSSAAFATASKRSASPTTKSGFRAAGC
jgi:DNA-binding response OmpR family regulator